MEYRIRFDDDNQWWAGNSRTNSYIYDRSPAKADANILCKREAIRFWASMSKLGYRATIFPRVSNKDIVLALTH